MNIWTGLLYGIALGVLGTYVLVGLYLALRWTMSRIYWWNERRRAKRDPIGTLRREMAFWSVDLSDMTDEEIREGALNVARVVGECGISCEEAAESLSAACRGET